MPLRLRRPTPIIPAGRAAIVWRTKATRIEQRSWQSLVPHFANDQGVEKIYVGVKEFQCMGARPPFDHPHVYLDMGADGQILCPYCSTLFVHDAAP